MGLELEAPLMFLYKAGILVIHREKYIPAARTGMLTFWVSVTSANPLVWFLDPIGFRNVAELQGWKVPWVSLELRVPLDCEGHSMPTFRGTLGAPSIPASSGKPQSCGPEIIPPQ